MIDPRQDQKSPPCCGGTQFLAEMIYSCVSSTPAPALCPLPQSCLISRALTWAGFRDIQGTALGHPDLAVEPASLKIPLGNRPA